MKPQRWKQIDELFDAALQIDLEKRVAFLDQACLGDLDLRKEVETLLASDDQEHDRVEESPMQLAADLLKDHSLKDHSPLLTLGQSIGPYRILSLLGSGGMGDVYRASDPRIGREVAIKILQPQFSQDSERVRRFEQEARAAGALNHPNIVAVYDAGTDRGFPYLVSEFLRGEVLQQKLSDHLLPIRKTVDYSLQIARGLSAAHDKGIIHRDLKPGNIFITKEGRVKILDFGLAKLIGESPGSPIASREKAEDLTETGVVVGTVVYMSPEQVSGRKVDHRSDIFAFGAVLYEMLFQKRPFAGDTQIEIMHAILKSDPPALSQSGGTIAPSLERIVRRCLEKNPDDRFQSTSDLAFALDAISSTSGTAVAVVNRKRPIHLAWILSAFFFVAALMFGGAFYRLMRKVPPENYPPVQRLSIVLPENCILNSMAISPDGRRLAYVINGSTGLSKLWLRSLDSTAAEEIPDTEDATLPFWSPDGGSIGFFTEHELKKFTIGGGPPETLCEVDIPKGGTWNQYGDILFSPSNDKGLYRISAQGGEATPVTTLDISHGEWMHRFPHFLPDGRHFFYLVGGSQPDYRGVFVGSFKSKDRKHILPDPTPVEFINPESVLFVRNGKLMLQGFDPDRLQFTGEALPIADNESNGASGPDFSMSESNVLVYADLCPWNHQPVWFDRSGKQSNPLVSQPSSIGEPGDYSFCDLAPDDRHLLTYHSGSMWIVDLINGSFIRYAMTNDNGAVFSPNGTQLANGEGDGDLYVRPSSGNGKAELVYHHPGNHALHNLSWSTDGKFLGFTEYDSKTRWDVWVLPLVGERKAFPYLKTKAREESLTFSPDGKWVAYESDESGQPEVYVRSFPLDAGGKWQISTEGGQQPIWRRDGKELFYLTIDKKLMATEVQTGQTFKAGVSRLLFQTHAEPQINPWGIGSFRQYFVSSDGKHFLINTLIDKTTPAEINVLLNWKSLLKRQ